MVYTTRGREVPDAHRRGTAPPRPGQTIDSVAAGGTGGQHQPGFSGGQLSQIDPATAVQSSVGANTGLTATSTIRLGGVARLDLTTGTWSLVGTNPGVIFFGFCSSPAAVPTPSSLLLFLAAGLALVHRNRPRKRADTASCLEQTSNTSFLANFPQWSDCYATTRNQSDSNPLKVVPCLGRSAGNSGQSD